MAKPSDIEEIKQRIALIETRLQQLFEHLDIAPRESAGGWSGGSGEPAGAIDDPEIQDLLAKGNQTQAIKRYRELTGVGLADAKEAIERAQQGG